MGNCVPRGTSLFRNEESQTVFEISRCELAIGQNDICFRGRYSLFHLQRCLEKKPIKQ